MGRRGGITHHLTHTRTLYRRRICPHPPPHPTPPPSHRSLSNNGSLWVAGGGGELVTEFTTLQYSVEMCVHPDFRRFRNGLLFVIGSRSRIHEHTISLRFPGIILRVLRLEISVYNDYIENQLQTTFARGVKLVN